MPKEGASNASRVKRNTISFNGKMGWEYENVKHRRGGKRAIAGIARIASACLRRMVHDQMPYEIGFRKAA